MAAPGPATWSTSTPWSSRRCPRGLHAELRPYQRTGFTWLSFLYQHGLGGVLADEMGLGKTLQALALICSAKRDAAAATAPFLVVAPTSVVTNWAAECRRFTPDLVVHVDHRDEGPPRADRSPRSPAGADVVAHLLHAVPAGERRLPGDGVGRADPRRGAVREEPPVEGLRLRPDAAGAVQARDHRHADGEQPDGAVVAAVDHGARACSPARSGSRSPTGRRSRRTATPSCSAGCAGGSSR